jgi:beta-glucuronidase
MLKPQANDFRQLQRLAQLWQFRVDHEGLGRSQGWWRRALEQARDIPVPASYNDLFVDAAIRDHVGDAWYQTELRVPSYWRGRRISLRFDAATHRATVWLDDKEIGSHEGGYTPFEFDITQWAQPGSRHRLTVCINNELHWHTIPPGIVEQRPDGRRHQHVFHDFFNYAGLHRPAWLCATAPTHISDLTVVTDYQGGRATVRYDVTTSAFSQIQVRLLDAQGDVVARAQGAQGIIELEKAIPWQPGKAYLYTLIAELTQDNKVVDCYELPVGIRSVCVEGRQLLINGQPFYFRGFGKHEDSAVRGKAHDDALMVHDFALLDWIGANSFRTSHYPYAEEVLEYADRNGIVVIDETAAVGLNISLSIVKAPDLPSEADLFSSAGIHDRTQQAHLQAIRKMIARDKNHPCVVLWSLANEPDVRSEASRTYFEPLVQEARRLDPSRPLTVVNVHFCGPHQDRIADLLDVICLNRYAGWYREGGDLVAAEKVLESELRAWMSKYDKPLMMTEYGADTMPGEHAVLPTMWTEEYQRDFLAMYHRVFDRVGGLCGEHVWTFSDFATPQGTLRVGGNRKGVFTRDRQPKAAAWSLRERWLAKQAA